MRRAVQYIVLLFTVLPLLTMLYLSLVSAWSFPQLWKAHFTTRYWSGVLGSDTGLASSLLLSLFISTTIATLATVFGFLASKALMFNARLVKYVQLAFYPYLIAPVVLGAMLQFYFVRWGLTGSLSGIFVAQLLFILPYSVLFMSAFWTDRVRQMAFQASSLGATIRQVDRTVLLPMAKPWLMLCFVQCFLLSWFEYGITRLIGVGKVHTLTVKVMHFIEEANPHQAALAACMMVLPVLLLLVVNQKLILKRENRV